MRIVCYDTTIKQGLHPGKARAKAMASIEFITKRIEGKQKEIKKLESKLARIEKAQATNWEVNPYYYGEDDLRWTLKDLAAAREALAKYEAQLTAETEKASSRNVTAILEFLEDWKRKVMEYYTDKFARYLVAYEEYCAKIREHADWFNHGGWRQENAKEIDEEYRKYRKAFSKRWGEMERYELREFNPETQQYDRVFNRDKLAKELEQEANAKYDDIIERTNAICGKITDARGLWVGNKGDLDGIIVGERGTAKVQTIGAGGYNIQCFHFRTLVHEVK